MNRRWKILLVVLFTGFLGVVGVQIFCPFLPTFDKLKGSVVEPPPVTWTWAEFKQGTVARQIEAWYNVHAGLRNLYVALDNQVSYSVFGEVNPRAEGSRVIAGGHDWFFEYQYIETAVSTSQWKAAVPGVVQRLKSVQEKLARRGIPLLVIVAPSKVEVYPEHVPAAYFAGRKPADYSTDFELARPLMQAAGIISTTDPPASPRGKPRANATSSPAPVRTGVISRRCAPSAKSANASIRSCAARCPGSWFRRR